MSGYKNMKTPRWYPKLLEMLKHEQYLVGENNSAKLEHALRLTGNEQLLGKTLLDKNVRVVHASELNDRYQRKWNKRKELHLRKLEKKNQSRLLGGLIEPLTDYELASQSLRFLTLVHSVVELCPEAALHEAKALKQEINNCVNEVAGVACLGALEIEVISIEKMRRIRELNNSGAKSKVENINSPVEQWRMDEIEEITKEQEHRKLEVCEALGGYLSNSVFSSQSAQLLVHFHGVVAANDESKFDALLNRLKGRDQWQKAPRQIELKKLSEQFAGKKKPVEDNLRDIATYITKGGNDWHAGDAYLRYKLRFENGLPLSIDEWLQLNWRNEKIARGEHMEEGTQDSLSLTPYEISVLAQAIDGMMNWNTTRTGYLVTVGRW